MRNNLDEQRCGAYQHATECAERAHIALEPSERDLWLTLEKSYLVLARSTESTGSNASC